MGEEGFFDSGWDEMMGAMSEVPNCPKCACEFTYRDGANVVCPECAHEWDPASGGEELSEGERGEGEGGRVWRDANGNELKDGDTVSVIKDLKVKGSSTVVKAGTKVKNIRLVEGDHDIDCRVEGVGAMGLKSEFVRKV
jgi:protein PhnA